MRSEVECVRRAGRVGNGLVASIMAAGIPEDNRAFRRSPQASGGGAMVSSELRLFFRTSKVGW